MKTARRIMVLTLVTIALTTGASIVTGWDLPVAASIAFTIAALAIGIFLVFGKREPSPTRED